jgi:RimJ/RimL family protein N-acetyltransferase
MLELVRLQPEHLFQFTPQAAQSAVLGMLTEEYARSLVEQSKVGWTGLVDGHVVGCAGLAECWPGRAEAWTLLADDAFGVFRQIHRTVRDVLAKSPWHRVEMKVDASHDAAIRWAEHLGFVREALMRKYTADQRDVYLYAKVK